MDVLHFHRVVAAADQADDIGADRPTIDEFNKLPITARRFNTK